MLAGSASVLEERLDHLSVAAGRRDDQRVGPLVRRGDDAGPQRHLRWVAARRRLAVRGEGASSARNTGRSGAAADVASANFSEKILISDAAGGLASRSLTIPSITFIVGAGAMTRQRVGPLVGHRRDPAAERLSGGRPGPAQASAAGAGIAGCSRRGDQLRGGRGVGVLQLVAAQLRVARLVAVQGGRRSSTTRRMFAEVSVMTIALLPPLAVTSASVPISGVRSCRSFTASTLATGMTCVISSSVASMSPGSAPKWTGTFDFFAASRPDDPQHPAVADGGVPAGQGRVQRDRLVAAVTGWRLNRHPPVDRPFPHHDEPGGLGQVLEHRVERGVAEF